MIALMPVMIIVFLVLIVFALIKWQYSHRRYSWLLISYLVVMVIAAGVYYLLPKETAPDVKVDTENGSLLSYMLYDAAYDGNIQKYDQYVEKSWKFPAKGKKLVLETMDEEDEGVDIFVERTADQKDHIEAAYYQPPVIINGTDISDQIKPPEIHFADNRMTVYSQKLLEFSQAVFQMEFTIRQFTAGDGADRSEYEPYHSPAPVLYILVPENIKVLKQSDSIVLVGEDEE